MNPDREGYRRAGVLTLWLATALCLVPPGAQATETENRFIWDQANARLAAARTPPEFAEAAELYHQLILQGARNAPLFYNYGIALLEAQRVEDAARAFQRAERYAGHDAEVRQNLAATLARNQSSGQTLLPWYRVFLFWHFGLDLSTRASAALVGFSLLCVALALRLWGRRGAAAQLHAVAVVLMVVFGSSVGASLHAESRDQSRERALGAIQAITPP